MLTFAFPDMSHKFLIVVVAGSNAKSYQQSNFCNALHLLTPTCMCMVDFNLCAKMSIEF